jgi:hypothetical protein
MCGDCRLGFLTVMHADWTGWNQVRVELADPSSVSPCQEEDHGGRRQADELEQNEYRLPTVNGQCSDEQAADEPHRPRAVAYSHGAVLSPEVDYLRHVGRDRDHDSSSTKDLKHRFCLSVRVTGLAS